MKKSFITSGPGVSEFVFNIPPTAKVIWRQSHALESQLTDWRSWGSNMVSGLSTTPCRLLNNINSTLTLNHFN